MAGIYLHIPFCKQACHYCDFHFSTSLRSKDAMLEALNSELKARVSYLEGQPIETIYLGGGTPSLLSTDELQRLFEIIHRHYNMAANTEVTLEANPDDLTYLKILELRRTPVNRLSIGIQSFRDEDLRWMNRAHTVSQADYSVKCAQDRGFENITIDLIYSIPGMGLNEWQHTVRRAIDLQVQHISAYSLTIEPKTVLGNQFAKGEMQPASDSAGEEQFLSLVHALKRADFEQYEVSNFCRPGMHSRHNSAYWKGAHYLGIGPSAHSFNANTRQWNVANNPRYIAGISGGTPSFELEVLGSSARFNEYLLTRLRTTWGIDLEYLQHTFGIDVWAKENEQLLQYEAQGWLMREGNTVRLTEQGLLRADRIASNLFIVET
ncbi:MAG: radical SAM family heme chaperone HemW [Flavobacteriales bacterium]